MTTLWHLFPDQDRPLAQRWLNALANAPQAERWKGVAVTCIADVQRMVFYELAENGHELSVSGQSRINEILEICVNACDERARAKRLDSPALWNHCQKRFLGPIRIDKLQKRQQGTWPQWREPLARLSDAGFTTMTGVPVKWSAGNLTTFLKSQVFWAARDLRHQMVIEVPIDDERPGPEGDGERPVPLDDDFEEPGPKDDGKGPVGEDPIRGPISLYDCYRLGWAHYGAAVDRLVDRLSDQSRTGRPVGLRARRQAANRIRIATSRLRSQIDLLSHCKPTVEEVEVLIWRNVQIKVPISQRLAEFCKLGVKPTPLRCLGLYLEGWVDGLLRLAEQVEMRN